MYLIGLTGNIATGKSLVAARLAEHGARHIDADRVAHRTMEPGEPAWEQVRRRFGDSVLRPDGTADRPALARIVFGDPEALQALEGIVHPQVLAHIDHILASAPEKVVVVEAIKLLESGLADRCRAVWVTTCDADLQLERLRRDRGLTTEDARRRMNGQPDAAHKVARADVLFLNEGTRADLAGAVDQEWDEIGDETAPGFGTVPIVQDGGAEVVAREGRHEASARLSSAGSWQLDCRSPTRLPRLLRPLLAAVGERDGIRHLHVPRQTGYLQFMRGMGFEEVTDRVTESGYTVFRR